MLSFNAYGSASKETLGAHKPVWLGTVAPHAVGGVLASAYRVAGLHIPAGTPVNFTEGILTRMLVDDPALEGVDVVIFDEFHERSLQSDVALALTRET